ncbi:hypothetical protein GOP47_0020505 [Adiantum capillus-veneris]|uniref:Uncharacterized protein n=1 Tax=Adiantum capillus-veneris TaxID=13818 RepID=A0A9D4Z7I2_ADICA|nr:hypothetical protein GOP47_0020505 [Adiantum capillus-veneris]
MEAFLVSLEEHYSAVDNGDATLVGDHAILPDASEDEGVAAEDNDIVAKTMRRAATKAPEPADATSVAAVTAAIHEANATAIPFAVDDGDATQQLPQMAVSTFVPDTSQTMLLKSAPRFNSTKLSQLKPRPPMASPCMLTCMAPMLSSILMAPTPLTTLVQPSHQPKIPPISLRRT